MHFLTQLRRFLIISTVCSMSLTVLAEPLSNPSPLGGWNILQSDYEKDDPLDAISYEWDYFMIHDAKNDLYATIGYLISNPRAKKLMGINRKILPEGGNMAIIVKAGEERPSAQYINFGLDHYEASENIRSFSATSEDGKFFGKETPLPDQGDDGTDAMKIEGRSADFVWELIVNGDYEERATDAQRPVTGYDVGWIKGEKWTVDVIWPRTHVKGYITNLKTNKTYTIDTHGYRENSWGRYILAIDGWDFYVFSEDHNELTRQGINPHQGVVLTMQTYHKSNMLDYTDLSFYDEGEIKNLRFTPKLNQMGWKHDNWEFNTEAHQCMPTNMRLELENDEYRINATVDYPMDRQRALLSNVTPIVSAYVIENVFPYYKGTIYNKKRGEVVRNFSGFGGGEFSFIKAPLLQTYSQKECLRRFSNRFAAPMPSEKRGSL